LLYRQSRGILPYGKSDSRPSLPSLACSPPLNSSAPVSSISVHSESEEENEFLTSPSDCFVTIAAWARRGFFIGHVESRRGVGILSRRRASEGFLGCCRHLDMVASPRGVMLEVRERTIESLNGKRERLETVTILWHPLRADPGSRQPHFNRRPRPTHGHWISGTMYRASKAMPRALQGFGGRKSPPSTPSRDPLLLQSLKARLDSC